MANRFFDPLAFFLDSSGDLLSGGKLYFYLTGTSTATNTYSNSTLITANANPVVLNASGRLPNDVFLDPAITYKVVLKDSADVTIWTADPVVDPAANVTAAVQVYAGNPNGNVAGNAGSVGGVGASMVWDITNRLLYICTTTGTTLTAVWTQVASSLSGLVQLTGIISPLSLSANQNDYSPTGNSSNSVIRQDASANVNITGLAGGASGAWKRIINISAANVLTFVHESSSSTAANRFTLGGVDVSKRPGEWIDLWYDSTSSRWRADGDAPLRGATTLTDAATIAWDLSAGGPDYQVTLGGNRTLGAFTNGITGHKGKLMVFGDATGGRTLDMTNSVYKFPGNVAFSPTLGISSRTVYEFRVRNSTAMEIWPVWGNEFQPGFDLLEKQTVSASATANFVLTSHLSNYKTFMVVFESVIPSTDDVDLWLRTSTNGGSSYSAGANDYAYIGYARRASNDAGDVFRSTGAAQILLSDQAGSAGGGHVGNGADEGISGWVRIFDPNNSATRTRAQFDTVWIPADQTTDFVCFANGGGIRDAAADVDAVRFMFSSGNIASGFFGLYGLRR